MPQIRQYEQQVNPAGPAQIQNATAQEFGGGVGEALKGLGNEVLNAQDVLYRREVQNDVSDVDTKVSNARSKLTSDLLDQRQKGTLDVDKFKAHVDETMDAASDGIQTQEGQNLFNRHKASSQLEFTVKAIEGAADLAGKKTLANFQDSMNVDIGTLANDPTQRDSLLAKKKDWIDTQVKTGLLQADVADKLKLSANQTYAEAAMRGTARYAPELAQKQLDNPSDPVNSLLGETGRYKMQIEVDHYQRSKDAMALKMQKAAEEAAAARSQEIQSGWYDKLEKNQLSADTINFGPDSKNVEWQDKKRFTDMLRARQTERIGSDNPTMRNAVADMMKPYDDPTKKIKSEADITQMYVDGRINGEGMKMLRNEFANSNTGSTATEVTKFKKTGLWKDAYQQIAKPNSMGVPDPQGLHNFDMWQTDTLNKIHKGQQDGSYSDKWLTDEKDPNYLGSAYTKYQRSMEDIMKDQAARISNTGPSGEEMVQVVNPQGVSGKIPKSKLQEKIKAGYKEAGK